MGTSTFRSSEPGAARNFFSENVYLPCQWSAAHGCDRWLPEHRLWLAVLEDCRRLLRRPSAVAADRAEAVSWVSSRDDDGPFSFVAVCACLGLNPTRTQALMLAGNGPPGWHGRAINAGSRIRRLGGRAR